LEVAEVFKASNYTNNLGICYNNMGIIYLKKKLFKQARQALDKSITLLTEDSKFLLTSSQKTAT